MRSTLWRLGVLLAPAVAVDAQTAADSRALDSDVKTIGNGHGCFGPTADPAIRRAYLELRIGSKTCKGTGECHYVKLDFPERGIKAGHCFLDPAAPDDQYTGGLFTTNWITSLRSAGPDTEPPGYTIRVWGRRSEGAGRAGS